MSDAKELGITPASAGTGTGGSVSLGKGAWCCDSNREIPPDKEAEVFEEIATLEFQFEGIPTVPPRKDMEHFAFFCDGCRYRVKGSIDETAAAIKQRLWEGGCGRGSDMSTGARKVINSWEEIELIYAGQRMANEHLLKSYHVPPGCKCMIAIDRRLLDGGKPDLDSAYWN